MGLSSSKTKTKNEPWAPAQPYILKGLENSGRVFDAQQPTLDRYAADQYATYGRLAPGAEQGIIGAQGLVNDTISGKYLGGNPWLSEMIKNTNSDVTDGVMGEFMNAGRYGSGYNQKVLADALARNTTGIRYQDYSTERQNQNNAVDQAQGLMNGSQGFLNNAAELPWIGVGALNGNVRQASNGYGTTTTKQSGNIGQMLGGIAGSVLSSWAGSGFKGG